MLSIFELPDRQGFMSMSFIATQNLKVAHIFQTVIASFLLINVQVVLIITISFHLLRRWLWTGNTCTMTLCVSPLWTYALHRQDGVGGLELIPFIVASSASACALDSVGMAHF